MSDVIKMGIVGLGRISSLHIPAYDPKFGLPVEITAICDKSKKNLAEASKLVPNARQYTNYDEFISDSDLNAVEILTPHHLHLKHTLKAMNRGLHVSLQKVPAMGLEDMDQMIHTAQKNHVKFRVFENFRFYDPYLKAKEIISSGVIGEVVRVDYKMISAVKSLSQWDVPLKSWQWRISEKGNYKAPTLFDDGYHKHSVIAELLKNTITGVIAWKGAKRVMGAVKWDLPASVIYTCKDSAKFANWNTSMHDFFPMHSDYYGCDEYVEIYGEKGAIYLPGCTGSFYESANENGPGKAGVHWVDSTGKWYSDCSMNTDWARSFINCSHEFIKAIKEDRQPAVTPEDARYILQIALATMRSVRNNSRLVPLNEIKDKP